LHLVLEQGHEALIAANRGDAMNVPRHRAGFESLVEELVGLIVRRVGYRDEAGCGEHQGHTKPVFRRYERESTYTTREYRDLLSTYSGHRALAPDAREALLGCIGELIDTPFGGRIAKRYMTELAVAYRHPTD
jgi:hypothetical protein